MCYIWHKSLHSNNYEVIHRLCVFPECLDLIIIWQHFQGQWIGENMRGQTTLPPGHIGSYRIQMLFNKKQNYAFRRQKVEAGYVGIFHPWDKKDRTQHHYLLIHSEEYVSPTTTSRGLHHTNPQPLHPAAHSPFVQLQADEEQSGVGTNELNESFKAHLWITVWEWKPERPATSNTSWLWLFG